MTSSTLYVPIVSPPTPAPSPPPSLSHTHTPFPDLSLLPTSQRIPYLSALLTQCTPSELLFISDTVTPLLKRDFLNDLPPELALYVLSFVNEPATLARAGRVSRCWARLAKDEGIWRRMCLVWGFGEWGTDTNELDLPLTDMEDLASYQVDPAIEWIIAQKRKKRAMGEPYELDTEVQISYRRYFRSAYKTMMNWRTQGTLLRAHRVPNPPNPNPPPPILHPTLPLPPAVTTTTTPTASPPPPQPPPPPPPPPTTAPLLLPTSAVITSTALSPSWLVVGLVNCRIQVFSAKTGVLARTLVGHEGGVWGVWLVEAGGRWGGGIRKKKTKGERRSTGAWDDGLAAYWDAVKREGKECTGTSTMNARTGTSPDSAIPPSMRTALGFVPEEEEEYEYDLGPPPATQASSFPSPELTDECSTTPGWGQPNALVISGGCDKVLRVWDLKSGYCIHVLRGHTSTIRCFKALPFLPLCVTGSRDATIRIWDIRDGKEVRVLRGHTQSVRCLGVRGRRIVSGSYDTTLRVWDIDTGECIHVLRGHFHQIYSVAFDGTYIASGGLDTTVRVWDANTGTCLALLTGHTALVCQIQLAPGILATGGSDGRVITFSLSNYTALHRLSAHESSVTSLQFDSRFMVTGGDDGRVRLFETKTGNYVRELTESCDTVWKVCYRRDVCAVMCRRAGKTCMEIWSFRPKDE